MLRVRAQDSSCFVALCNAVGGQDELIFDGHSVVIDDEGEVLARARGFGEELLVIDIDPVASVGRRLRDVRRRALGRERGPVQAVELELAPPRPQTDMRHGVLAARATSSPSSSNTTELPSKISSSCPPTMLQ